MAQQLRKTIKDSKKTINAIAVEVDIPQPALCRFASDYRGLTMRTAQKLADYFGLELRPKQ